MPEITGPEKQSVAPRSPSTPQKRTPLEITLLGQKIPIKTSENDPELVAEIVSLVSVLLRDAEKRTKGAVAHQVALLALLELAQDYVKAKRRASAYRRDVQAKTGRLVDLVQDVLK